MDKESGVYITIEDNSFQTGGASNLVPLVTMLTTKGNLGLNLVNATNFKSLLGYDLKYNSNYLGLSKILENVSYAYVWRLNQNAKLANAFFMSTTSDKESDDDCEAFEEITERDPKPVLAVSLKDLGNPETYAVKLKPTVDEQTVTNENPTTSTPQIIAFTDISQTEKDTYDSNEIKGGCVFYNASNNSIVGIIKPNFNGELKIYKVVDGQIVDDIIETVNINAWSDGTNYYNSSMEIMPKPEGEESPSVVLGTVRKATYQQTTVAWQYNNKYYNSDVEEIEKPEGTAGTKTTIGEGYIPSENTEHLIKDTMYITNDVGTTFYVVSQFGDTFADCTLLEVTDADTIAELTALYTGNSFKDVKTSPFTSNADTGFYEKKSGFWYKVISFGTTAIATNDVAEANEDIMAALESASDITISYSVFTRKVFVTDNSCGNASWDDENNLTVTLFKPLSKDTFWTVRTIPTTILNWTLVVAGYADDQYTIKETYDFSTDTESDIYWEKLNFGDINFFVNGNISSTWDAVRNYFTLDNGSNGDNGIIASDIDVTLLEKASSYNINVIALNGITNYKVANKIASKAETLFIHTFADAPAYSSYNDLAQWIKNIYHSEYLAVGARPDQVEIAENEYVYVYPSVNYIKIFADMLSNYQNLYYPPAGLTYGGISIENLIECDYENYGNELKTARINWQRVQPRGSVMWEQRTTYSLDTDLSYIAPNFIVDGLRSEIYNFETQFNFRYTSPTDLLNQESGLKGILDNYVTGGFVYQYELDIPTYAEAQKAGRTLTIKIGVALSKDAEVIYIVINLHNAT